MDQVQRNEPKPKDKKKSEIDLGEEDYYAESFNIDINIIKGLTVIF